MAPKISKMIGPNQTRISQFFPALNGAARPVAPVAPMVAPQPVANLPPPSDKAPEAANSRKRKSQEEEDDDYNPPDKSNAPVVKRRLVKGRKNRKASATATKPKHERSADWPRESDDELYESPDESAKSTKPAAPAVPAVPAVPAEPVELPEPHGQPEVWSEKRAGLTDATDYYKSHQGSMYTKELKPQGMFLDSETTARDYFDSQVIITSIGGGRVKDAETGKMTREANQSEDGVSYRALAGAVGKLIVVIAGAGNPRFPVKMPHYYCVLGYFYITDVWAERSQGIGENKRKTYACFKVRLEKRDLDVRSWFAPRDATAVDAGEYKVGEHSCNVATCMSCRTESKEIFTKGWTCLKKGCERFFDIKRREKVDSLVYNENFFRERRAFKMLDSEDSSPFGPIKPPVPQIGDGKLGCEGRFKQGIVCPLCGCCSRRIKWSGWYCENSDCDYELPMPIKPVQPESYEKQAKESSKGFYCHKSVIKREFTTGKYRGVTYLIPGERGEGFIGSVTVLKPIKETNSRPGGTNDLYAGFQSADIGLERRAAKNARQIWEELTSHFSSNSGATYKFGVVVDFSWPFEFSPSPILETQLRLSWGAKKAVEETQISLAKEGITVDEAIIPHEFVRFNEQLVLGYFESSKIGAHDDGEKEVGPTVASLSLGCASIMKFMPKRNLEIGDDTGDKMNRKVRTSLLSIRLNHGDIMVMHGSQIQKMYNHSLVPCGIHRFAATCRHIVKETIPNAEARQRAETDGKIPDKWAAIQYNGEVDEFQSIETGEVTALPS